MKPNRHRSPPLPLSPFPFPFLHTRARCQSHVGLANCFLVLEDSGQRLVILLDYFRYAQAVELAVQEICLKVPEPSLTSLVG